MTVLLVLLLLSLLLRK